LAETILGGNDWRSNDYDNGENKRMNHGVKNPLVKKISI